MQFRPAYPKDLTNDLTNPAVVALNRPTFWDFLWNFTTKTNAGRCFVIAVLALGLFSSLTIVFTVLPIGSIPIIGYILTSATGIGSFGALLVMLGVATPVAFTYFKKRDIWTFPTAVTSGLKMITRCGIALDFLKQINWNCLEFGKAGSNVKQIFDELTSAFTSRTGDASKYSNAPIKYAEKLLLMKGLPQIMGSVIRAIDAILRLRRQENFNFALVDRYDLLLCTLQHIRDYIIGDFDEAIGQSPVPYVSGITHAILKVTDGKATEPNREYNEASIRHLYNSIADATQKSRQIGKAFPFSVDRESVMTDPEIDTNDEELKDKINTWRSNVEAYAVAAMESFDNYEIGIPQKAAIKLYEIYGMTDDIEVELRNEIVGGIELPDEVLQLLRKYQDLGRAFASHAEGESKQIRLHRGRAIPQDGIAGNGDQMRWARIASGDHNYDDIKAFFPKIPEDIKLDENMERYYVPTAWIKLNVKVGDTKLPIALPAILMRDKTNDIWIALAGEDNGFLVPTTPWLKYDPTDPAGTASALCEAATEKPLSEIQKDEEEARRHNREQMEKFDALVKKHQQK
jgi:hypothetical protein